MILNYYNFFKYKNRKLKMIIFNKDSIQILKLEDFDIDDVVLKIQLCKDNKCCNKLKKIGNIPVIIQVNHIFRQTIKVTRRILEFDLDQLNYIFNDDMKIIRYSEIENGNNLSVLLNHKKYIKDHLGINLERLAS
jgi:hypothetical protein